MQFLVLVGTKDCWHMLGQKYSVLSKMYDQEILIKVHKS